MNMEQKHLSEDDITFMITPRLNAASRMDDPMRAYEVLSTDDEAKADALAEKKEKKKVVPETDIKTEKHEKSEPQAEPAKEDIIVKEKKEEHKKEERKKETPQPKKPGGPIQRPGFFKKFFGRKGD